MRTAANRLAGHSQSKGMMRVAGPLWNPLTQFSTSNVVAYGGHTWSAIANVGRGHAPQGVGDGTTADRDLLMAARNGHAAAITGGYANPATYVVTRADDALDPNGNPSPGTLRYGLSGQYNIDHPLPGQTVGNYWDPLWIVFHPSVTGDISITQAGAAYNPFYEAPNKTVDGRGGQRTIRFVRNDTTPLFGFNCAGVKQPNNAGTPWNRDAGGWTGISNVIWAYVTVINDNHSNINCEVFSGSGYGRDLRWWHHVETYGGGDGILDQILEADYYVRLPQFGIHAENALGRVTIDWCKVGPHPVADSLLLTYQKTAADIATGTTVLGAYLGADNQSNDGKAALLGLHPQDGYRADNLRITAHHNIFRSTDDRSPKVACSRVHWYNNWTDHYGQNIGMADSSYMAVPTDLSANVTGGVAHGWSPALLATLNSAHWNYWPYPIWRSDELDHKSSGYGSECSRDGELLLENSVWTGYTEGEDHLLNDALVAAGFITTPQRWKTHDVARAAAVQAITNHGAGNKNWPDPIMVCRGHLFEGSAAFNNNVAVVGGVGYFPDPATAPFGTAGIFAGWRNGHYNASNDYVGNTNWTWKQDAGSPYVDAAHPGDGGAGPDWGGVVPYDYLLYTADSTLKDDLTRSAGNVQPWQFVA